MKKKSPDDMTPQQLHKSMMDFARKVSANKRTARAFLERIGAPLDKNMLLKLAQAAKTQPFLDKYRKRPG